MLYVVLALVASNAVTVAAFANLLRVERRQSARERELLVNQLLHAVDRPWQPAPAWDSPSAEAESESRLTVALPEQYPEDDL